MRKSLSGFLDQKVAGKERSRIMQHLAECRDCAVYLDEMSETRAALKNLPAKPVPERLKTQLLIIASRERMHWNATKTLPLALRTWIEGLRLTLDNLMRPLALPFAGGVASALFLFSMLVPTLGVKPIVRNDVPTSLYTAATLVEVPSFGINNDETVVELYIDDKGQAMDYSVQRGTVSPELQADLTKMMFLSRFTPATWFGQPTNGKVLVSFRRVHYVVRG